MIRLTALTLAGSAILGLSGMATPAAAACDPPQDVYIRGAEAHWTECHNGGRTQVDGWVKDNKADGKCAEVYSMFSNGKTQRSNRACPKGEVERFHFDQPAGDAQTYLRLIG